MTVVAEHRQNFLLNERTPFSRFFNHVLNINDINNGNYIPGANVVVDWANQCAVDYGATVEGGIEGYGDLEMTIRFHDPVAYTLWLLKWGGEREKAEA